MRQPMRRWIGTCLGLAVAAALTAASGAEAGETSGDAAQPLTFALIGDTPYGDAQEQQFPALVQAVNADPKVRMVLHAGDVKTGSSTCDDARFARLAGLFETFRDPFVLTPGDNEWTDCHRRAAGGYVPTERLEAVRQVFFPRPGRTLGVHSMVVDTQADDPAHSAYVENVLFEKSSVVFATVHVVGSENDLEPWSQLPGGDRPDLRLAEFEARQAAALAWIDHAFDTAEDGGAAGVLLMMQAEPTATPGFQAVRDRIVARATAFGRPVLLVHGDEHIYEVEPGYAGVPNLTRLETFGDTAVNWLRVSVHPRSDAVFSWTPETVAQPATLSSTPEAVAPPATLLGRAILASDAYQPGPPSGAAVLPDNGVTPPFPGQPIPGFSAVLDAGGGQFWGMPDNGYGTKANSFDFLLRLYRIAVDFETDRGGSGSVDVLGHIQLRDPNGVIPFPLTRPDRLLTGSDFDIESVRMTRDGTFWFGDEFGPFLLHVAADGTVLEPPVPLPGVQSPQNPYLGTGTPNLGGSRGFEPMALSIDGRTLYPWLEGALITDPDQRRRIVNEFDLNSRSYTGRTWSYRVDEAFPGAVIGDVTALDEHRFVLIERDDGQGEQARQKKIYLVDLRRVDADGYLEKTLVLDLLHIADPAGISLPARPGEYGVGYEFSFPLQSVESLEVLGGERLLIANDNNYPGSDGRWIARDRPDDIELIVVHAPALR
jgi:hypothetical protein